MTKKYKLSLLVIGIMFLFVLAIATGYGVWVSTQDDSELSAVTLDCFKVYFSDSDTIEMQNIDPIVNDEGIETSPYTLTITNICEETKELQVRLNILNDTTVDTNALTIQAAGNIEKETTLYKNLSNAKTTSEDVSQSKLIGMVTVEPNETVRTNIKIWFDEKKSPTIDSDKIFKARFELIDTESTIKSTFAETLLSNISTINSDSTPNFSTASYNDEGLNVITTDNGNLYYYRGVVTNNYVKFANLTWRIVAINPDNSVKLILNNSSTTMSYSENSDAIDYTGLKYIYNGETINNNINTYLEEWYNTTIVNNDLDKYVTSSTYCNDSSYTVNNYHTYFGAYQRIINSKEPTITCPETNADFGGTYNQKVGLITADEVSLAGGLYNTNNYNYYLYNGENFFTETPAEYYNYHAYMFIVTNSGNLNISNVDSEYGIRPVINLDSTVTVSGSGTSSDPYIIDLD